MAGKAQNNALPPKEAALFRNLVKLYESKQNKKALKVADQILRKHPDHGETQAMKGLVYNCLEKKEEAYELVRAGLKNDLKSHVCWHVYGLLHRSDRNYEEAIKCYKNALRLDKENQQILRDLAMLQVHIRDLPAYVDCRHQLLLLKPSSKPNWLSFAISAHLVGDLPKALSALTAFQATQEDIAPSEAYEHSELLLYKAMLLEEGDQLDEALSHLDASREAIVDQLGVREAEARILLKLGRLGEAETAYRALLDTNSSNLRYHQGLLASRQLQPVPDGRWTPEQVAQLTALYDELREAHPRSPAMRRAPLDFLEGEAFEAAAEEYVVGFLRRGVPSLFSDLRSLYRSPAKVAALGALFERLLRGVEGGGRLPGDETKSNGEVRGGDEALLWTRFCAAQHADHLGDTGAALELVEACLKDDPGVLEVLSLKARILKHAGDPRAAAAAAVAAQGMDRADRYVNSKAAKALFRAGELERAEKMAALFTKDAASPEALVDMQCMWYETEAGTVHLKERSYGKALKCFTAVLRHFDDFLDDQFDFHSYCVRKMTLRAYVNMIRMEDHILDNIYAAKAGWAAVEAWLALDGAPRAEARAAEEEAALLAAMSLDERKRHKQQRRKEAQRRQKAEEGARAAEAAAAERAQKEAKNKKAAPQEKKEKDPDPDGAKLAAAEQPLEVAAKLLVQLKKFSGHRLRTHILAFEVYMRRGRHMLALQAVKRALEVGGAADPDVHRITLRFALAAQDLTHANEVVQAVIRSQVESLLDGLSPDAFNKAYAQAHGAASVRHRAAAAEMLALLQPEESERAAALLLDDGGDGLEGAMATPEPSHADCIEVHELLRDRLSSPQAAEAWYARCRRRFRWSAYFDGEERTLVPKDALEVPSGPYSAMANGRAAGQS